MGSPTLANPRATSQDGPLDILSTRWLDRNTWGHDSMVGDAGEYREQEAAILTLAGVATYREVSASAFSPRNNREFLFPKTS